MLSRNKVYQKIEADKEAKKIFIFCEGDREVRYFTFLKGFSSNIDIVPIPTTEFKTDPSKLNEDAKLKIFGTETEKPKLDVRKEFGDEVWFAIDTDEWNKGNKIEILRSNCKEQTNWFVAQSNPCFEIWLYFHFHSVLPEEKEVNSFDSFKEFLNNKISGGFNVTKHPLFFQTAIINSERIFQLENNQPKFLSTEVFYLAKSILPFIKEIIDECLKLHE